MKIDQKEKLSNTMIISFMASAKQIAWRKKFARMSKAGAFKKKQSQSKSAKNPKSIGAKSNPRDRYTTYDKEGKATHRFGIKIRSELKKQMRY